ncbi:MAG: hypothetical protein KA791_05440 [Flavobacteriales bacterium]|nr:hypothetical protein [Flavobacteriales bacterium]
MNRHSLLLFSLIASASSLAPRQAGAQTPATYQRDIGRLQENRTALARTLVSDSTAKEHLLDSARTILFDALSDKLLPAWYGTPWDFNGTTRVPGEGTIACGYFVNTVLLDAGFDLPRIRWSQLAAEPVILKLAPKAKRFRDKPVTAIEAWLTEQGDGLYTVGLDNHVGFITRRSGTSRFVHSNYYHREIGVMAEPLDGDNPFAHSRYRIIGKLLDDNMMEAWLQGTSLDRR